jgi:hypothetical protein
MSNLRLGGRAAKDGRKEGGVADFAGIFARPMRVSGIGDAAVERLVEVDAAECGKLAELFGLPAILALKGDFVLTHERGGVIAATLRLRARVRQVCVVSLEAFDADVREDVALRFVPAARVKEGVEVELDPETLEGPDEVFYGGDVIDLGGVLAEQLALALDPYPRKPGAALAAGAADEEEAERKSPFGVLRGLGKRE